MAAVTEPGEGAGGCGFAAPKAAPEAWPLPCWLHSLLGAACGGWSTSERGLQGLRAPGGPFGSIPPHPQPWTWTRCPCSHQRRGRTGTCAGASTVGEVQGCCMKHITGRRTRRGEVSSGLRHPSYQTQSQNCHTVARPPMPSPLADHPPAQASSLWVLYTPLPALVTSFAGPSAGRWDTCRGRNTLWNPPTLQEAPGRLRGIQA